MNSNCIASELLRAYLHGDTSDIDAIKIGDHLRACADCRARIEAISEESQLHLSAHLKKEPDLGFIQKYRLLEIIGQGGMGTVYRALHTQLNRIVAIKLINADRLEAPQAKSRFTKEMQLLAQLEHPQIVRASDAGEHDGKPYFVMEYVHGMDLGQLLNRLGPLPYPEACELIKQAASALQYAHDRKILHRDVKPSNLILSSEGRLKLLDLGLAQIIGKDCDRSVTDPEFAVGTIAYMAPEVVLGGANASSRSDVYSLGVTLFQLLTGIKPYERVGAQSPVVDIAIVRPDIPPELAILIRQMISPIPEDRPATMLLVEQMLAPYSNNASLRTLVGEYYRWQNRSIVGGPSHSSYILSPPVQQFANPIYPSKAEPSTGSYVLKSKNRTTSNTVAILASLLAVVAILFAISREFRLWERLTAGGEVVTHSSGKPAIKEETADESPSATSTEVTNDSEKTTDPTKALAELEPVKQATLLVQPRGDFVLSLLQEGRVYLVSDLDGARYLLAEGEMRLPAGKFKLQFDSPVGIEEDGRPVTLESVSGNRLNLTASLKGPGFQFPNIPLLANACGTYYGVMWREGWSDKTPTEYELSIEVLSTPAPSEQPGSWMWLQVSGKNLRDPKGYSETAFIQIDYESWLRKQKLVIGEGYIEVTGLDVPTSWIKKSPTTSPNSFVIPFNGAEDWLATRKELELPANRISIYDYLTLFFASEDFAAANSTLRSVRASLATPGQRNAWLEDINNSNGNVSCYVVSSHPKPLYRKSGLYHIARRDEELFGFVEISVTLPTLKATCLRRGQSKEVLPGWSLEQKLANVRRKVVDTSTIESIAQVEEPAIVQPGKEKSFILRYFDFAELPSEPARVRWTGNILRGGRNELVDIQLQALESALIDGKQAQCLEVEVTSSIEGEADCREWARVWIDSEQYRDSAQYRMLRGWIAFDNIQNAFAIPNDGDLIQVIRDRLKSRTQSRFDRFGATDILIMAFGAKYTPKSKLGILRETLTGIFAGMDRTPKVHQQVTKLGPINGYLWEQNKSLAANYRFFRSNELPFGFVSTNLKVPYLVDVNLETIASTKTEDLIQSFFGSEATLLKYVEDNRQQLSKIQPINWRHWEWKRDGASYMAYAEFGGTVKSYSNRSPEELLVLVDGNERIIRVPVKNLTDESRQAIQQGRKWATYRDDRSFVLAEEQKSSDVVILRDVQNRSYLTELKYQTLPGGDKAWVDRLRKTKSLPDDLETIKQEWTRFYLYKSN
ncbi:MAG: protein kinase [Pirellula sp.]|nr:protein kinase [Pirellula sp.]